MSDKKTHKQSTADKPGQTEPINTGYRRKAEPRKSADEYAGGIRQGNRVLLSKAITFIESSRPETRQFGEEILEGCLPASGNSHRIGITGIPGVGKSTFIEAMGKHVINRRGRKPAVLAIDPSSSRTGGSILGDKTRMPFLSTSERAFVRPTPSSGTLGGVARRTRETILLCEAAGYDIIFIETMGVGQSETAVHSMVDFFLLLMLPGAGDELQGIKRGIMEMADLIAVNKAEQEQSASAERAKRDYENALSFYPPGPSGRKPSVHLCSSLENTGIEEIWSRIETTLEKSRENGSFSRRRKEQAKYWMHETIGQRLREQFYSSPDVKRHLGELEKKVESGRISSCKAAAELLQLSKK
ncbi:MAG: methylmalonyl Co-A mutase-associated GTPase MeaB [Balneolaceae bacterium]